MNILFVCTGNTCRSPMCEAYFNSLCRKSGRNDLFAESAGIFASFPEPASEFARTVLTPYDTEIEKHRSRQLTKELLEKANLIVPLTQSHRLHIGRLSPASLKKTRLLLDFVQNRESDVRDPFGGTLKTYADCFEEMKTALDALFEQLTKMENKTLK